MRRDRQEAHLQEVILWAQNITPEEIVEMQQLYRVLGTYAAVGRAMNPKRSASSVAKYVKMENVPRNIRIAVENLSRETK